MPRDTILLGINHKPEDLKDTAPSILRIHYKSPYPHIVIDTHDHNHNPGI